MSAEENKTSSDKADSVDESEEESSSEEYSDVSDDDPEEVFKAKEEYCIKNREIDSQFNCMSGTKRKEKIFLFGCKQNQIFEETAADYLQPLSELIENRDTRIQVAETVKKYRTEALELEVTADKLAATKNYQNEIGLLTESIREDILKKIKNLDEDRCRADNEYHFESYNKRHKSGYPEDRYHRKPVLAQAPFIVYNLKEDEIIEDLTLINCLSKSSIKK